MPYTKGEKKMMRSLKKKHGNKDGENMYYAMENLASRGLKFENSFSKKSKQRTKKRLNK